MGIIKTENPFGVVVAFGGQTAIKLTKFLSDNGVNILGTSYDAIDMAEDRERFDELLEKYHIKRPRGVTVMTTDEALDVADKIGYPVLLRPSYVLGGQNMIIAFNEDDVKEYMAIILAQNIENPILIDKYLQVQSLKLTPFVTVKIFLFRVLWSISSVPVFTRATQLRFIRHGISQTE